MRALQLSVICVETARDDSHKSFFFRKTRKKAGVWCKSSLLCQMHPAGFAKSSLVVCNPILQSELLEGYKTSLGLPWLWGPPPSGVVKTSICSADLHKLLKQSPSLLLSPAVNSSPPRTKETHGHFLPISSVHLTREFLPTVLHSQLLVYGTFPIAPIFIVGKI